MRLSTAASIRALALSLSLLPAVMAPAPAWADDAVKARGKTASARVLTHSFAAGEHLSFALPDPAQAADLPASDVSFAVTGSLVGDFEAGALALFGDARAAERAQIGAGTRVFSRALDADLELNLDPSKFYTLAVAWVNPDRPDDYAEYFTRIDGDVAASGGRFLYKMFDPDLSGTELERGAPDQITLVEWESRDSLRDLQSRETYQAASGLLRSGVSYFEFYALALRE